MSQAIHIKSQHLGDLIQQYLDAGRVQAVRRMLTRHNYADVADVFENVLTEAEAVQCFKLLSLDQAAQVLPNLSEDRQDACLNSVPPAFSSQVLRFMPSDDAVDILQELDSRQTRQILEQMPYDSETRALHSLMLEEPDTAAGLMSTDYISVSFRGRVGDALDAVRHAEEKDFSLYCYLIDEQGTLQGVVALNRLVRCDEALPLSFIATEDVKALRLEDDQRVVANTFRRYNNLVAMPVVDENRILRGVVSLQDVLEVVDEETAEAYYRTSGLSMEEYDEKNLLRGSVAGAIKARLPWLYITLFGQFIGAAIIASFHATVAQAVVAVSFMPLLSGLSGNLGTQSESIAVRGLALNQINDDNIWEKSWRELRVAFTTALILALSVATLAFVQYHHLKLSLLLMATILCSLSFGGVLGILLPYGYQKFCKDDPAGVAGPFITTLLDILTFSGYLYVLSLFLKQIM